MTALKGIETNTTTLGNIIYVCSSNPVTALKGIETKLPSALYHPILKGSNPVTALKGIETRASTGTDDAKFFVQTQ